MYRELIPVVSNNRSGSSRWGSEVLDKGAIRLARAALDGRRARDGGVMDERVW